MDEKGGAKLQEPKVEQLLDKLRELRRGKNVLDEENNNLESVTDKLQTDLEKLQAEAYQLQGIYQEKEELCRKLQFKCEESEQESKRQLKQSETSEELLEQYRCEIQEVKLKHRKLRMRFEKQLQQLIEQHKQLHTVFTSERLPDEVTSAENTKSQLLSAAV
ncbi:synaptonemal complex central element protein 1 [Nematolebias whitei]|uniref:synaptonemal complex central element protein 1 n=1 Tax=Nematolebias whitei TaxID=451745 RepID=UPI00189BE884|nr:synaptonemal complex central element protein 1 [Nematolebias whitei]